MAANDNQALLLQVSADLSKLEKAFKKANGIVDSESAKMERRAKYMAQKIEANAGKVDLGKAFTAGLDNSKLAILNAGSNRIGVLGDSLGALGPYGMAAAAGITAVVAALAGSRQAIAFADEIGDVAERLHVTTDALQEYRYAIKAAGGEEKGADEALEKFSETLGKAQQGLAKSERAFKALGFTRDQIRGFADAGQALDAVRQRMVGLSDAQRDAVISQFGLGGLKELLQQSVQEQDRLIAKAHELGVVMDAELIRRGGELNDEFEALSKVVDVQLKSALIDLAPILTGLLSIVANMAKFAADVADNFRSIDNKSERALRTRIENIDALLANPGKGAAPVLKDGKVVRAAERHGRTDEVLRAQRAEAQAQLDQRALVTATPPSRSITGTADKASGGGRSSEPRDTTAQRTSQVANELANAERQLLSAMLGLTDDIAARAEIQRQMLESERTQMAAQTERQRADILADKGISDAKREELIAQLDVAAAKRNEALDAELRGINAEAQIALDAERLETQRRLADAEIEELQAQLALDPTRKESAAIQKEILAIRKRIADAERKAEQDAKQARLSAATNGEGILVTNPAEQRSADRTYELDQQRIDQEHRSALDRYFDQIKDLSEYMENEGVSALEQFNRGIIDIGMNGGKGIDVLRSALSRLLSSIANGGLLTLEKAGADWLGGLFGNIGSGLSGSTPGFGSGQPGIPSYAVGTMNHPGGLAKVHANEIINLPKGSQVFTVAQSRRMMSGGGAPVINQTINLHAEGAVLGEDLLARAREEGVQIGMQAAQGGAAIGQYNMARNQRRALG